MDTTLEQSTVKHHNIIYKQILSDELVTELLEFFNTNSSNLKSMNGSNLFPQRKQMRNIDIELSNRITKEVYTTLSNYYDCFQIYDDNIRIYGLLLIQIFHI